MNAPKITERRELFRTPYFTLVGKHVSGQADDHPHYALQMSDYVAVVAATAAGELVLVRQFRPAVEAVTLELPAGTVDAGQTPESAIRRELIEETGYAARDITLLGELRPDTGRLSNRLWAFFATVERQPGAAAEPGIEVVIADPNEFNRLIATGGFNHALHLAAVLLAAQRGLIAVPAKEGQST